MHLSPVECLRVLGAGWFSLKVPARRHGATAPDRWKGGRSGEESGSRHIGLATDSRVSDTPAAPNPSPRKPPRRIWRIGTWNVRRWGSTGTPYDLLTKTDCIFRLAVSRRWDALFLTGCQTCNTLLGSVQARKNHEVHCRG